MTKPTTPPTLEDVLDTYLATVAVPDRASAEAWAQRFPAYANALREFAATRRVIDALEARLPRADADDVVADAEIDAAVRAAFAAESRRESARARPVLDNLVVEAKGRGLGTAALAARLGVSAPIVVKLSRRLIDAPSIPRVLVAAIAACLERSLDEVVRYLAGPPTLAPQGFHRATTPPAVGRTEDFYDAVRADPTLSPQQRSHWLALEPPRPDRP